jgi:Mg-chelatase subunit ChlD
MPKPPFWSYFRGSGEEWDRSSRSTIDAAVRISVTAGVGVGTCDTDALSMMRLFETTVCSVMLALLSATVVSAESVREGHPPGVVFVFDASGSMLKKIQGRTKDEIARRVMAATLSALPSDMQIGLVSFGHRRKGDCTDLEVVSPVGTPAKTVSKAVDGLKPKGETPLAQAVKLAATQFKDYEGNASVIVVSDGKEECGGDPCAAAREAVASGVRLQIHVIGFDVSPDEAEQLQCIAREGNGKYFSAANAHELTSALAAVAREAGEKRLEPTPVRTVMKMRPGTIRLVNMVAPAIRSTKRPASSWERSLEVRTSCRCPRAPTSSSSKRVGSTASR